VPERSPLKALAYGAPIGALGGLIGLGGAEFRLPVLKATFGYPLLRAVTLNLAVSLITLLASLAVRLRVSSASALVPLAPILLGLIAGSMAGAYLGASYANRIPVARLERIILVLLVAIGGLLIAEGVLHLGGAGIPFGLGVRVPLAAALGAGIGVVSSLLGVAGGELIIPTLVLIFGADIKIAGTASVLVSLPAVVVGLTRHLRRQGMGNRADLGALVVPMGLGSILGAAAGGWLVPFVPGGAIKVGLGAILIASAIRIFRHVQTAATAPPGLAPPPSPDKPANAEPSP
jgi:uncharacterized membrane protein YfcA